MANLALSKKMLAFAFPDDGPTAHATPMNFNGARDQAASHLVSHADLQRVTERSHEKTQVLWFFAEWCGHCRNMREQWDMAAAEGVEHADWHKVDCGNEGVALAQTMEVSAFPTIVRLRNGERQDHSGQRTRDALLAFSRE